MSSTRVLRSLAVLLMLLTASGILQAHNIIICKVSDSTSPVWGTFAFDVPGYGTVYVQAGQCSPEFVAPTSPITITEQVVTGTELIAVWTNPSTALTAFDLTARTATITVPEGSTVTVYFKNRKVTGNQGCTPGYWKNHLLSWADTGFSPGQTVGSVFTSLSSSTLASMTLLEALNGGGGSTLDDAIRILLRAAVAALLNAADNQVSYPLSTSQIISEVNAAIATGNRTTILALATRLDNLNNGPGGCPLGGPGTM